MKNSNIYMEGNNPQVVTLIGAGPRSINNFENSIKISHYPKL